MACAGSLQRLWEKPIWEGVWPYLDPWDSVCLRTASAPGKCGPARRALFLPDSERAGDDPHSFFSADVLKKCALIGMHIIAEEGRGGKSGCRTPDLGDTWKFGCPWSPTWESEGGAWFEYKSVSSRDSREDIVCNDALCVVGLYGPGDKVTLFLKDWELARVALSSHIALDMVCQEMREAC